MSATDQEGQLNMPPSNRSAWRDTAIYASDNRDKVLGGLCATEGITNENLYSMIEIFCFFTDTFTLHNNSGQLVERDGQKLQPGNYYITTNGSITITDEVALTRTDSIPSGTCVEPFRQAVRERDRRCIATGRPASLRHLGWWMNFKSTHIFPLEYEQQWNDSNYSRWITVPPADPSHGTINSMQNGILLTREMHFSFNNYSWSINPDDNHKIVCFTPDLDYYQIAGRHLDQEFLANPLRPSDELLRWHFRQAVLVNMKGLGEPCFESESPSSSDIMGITDEVSLTRTDSIPSGTHVEAFRQAVRERDRRCIATGRPAPLGHLGWWSNFESTHVFPLDYEQHWNDSNYSRWITVPPADLSHGTINSVQNGILLTREMQFAFNSYCWSIDVDDNHKIISFVPGLDQIAGRYLDQEFLADPLRPPDDLLRWHFREAVITNLRPRDPRSEGDSSSDSSSDSDNSF